MFKQTDNQNKNQEKLKFNNQNNIQEKERFKEFKKKVYENKNKFQNNLKFNDQNKLKFNDKNKLKFTDKNKLKFNDQNKLKFNNQNIVWTLYDQQQGIYFFSGTLEVPFYEGATHMFTLALVRTSKSSSVVMDKNKQPLLYNPGGPGGSGSDSAILLLYGFKSLQNVMYRYDIIFWDPRGVGETTPNFNDMIIPNQGAYLDPYLAITVDAYNVTGHYDDYRTENINKSSEYNNFANTNSSSFYSYISTNDTVDDMKRIINALGYTKLNLTGFSYGSGLGSIYSSKYPNDVGNIYIDSIMNPNEFVYGLGGEQDFIGVLKYFFETYCTQPDFPFYYPTASAAQTAYEEIVKNMALTPIPPPPPGYYDGVFTDTVYFPGQPTLPYGINDAVLYIAVTSLCFDIDFDAYNLGGMLYYLQGYYDPSSPNYNDSTLG